MTAPRADGAMRRGWCPGLYTPMQSGDGLLVRVRPRLGAVTAAQLAVVAEMAARHGNGRVDITNRGNLQLRGLGDAGLAPVAQAIVACGLAEADPGREARRCVVTSPLAGLDPGCAPDTLTLAGAVEAALLAAELDALPGKALVAVDGGGAWPLGLDGRADAVLRAGPQGWWLLLPGAEPALPPDPVAAVLRVMRRLTRDPRPGARAGDDKPVVGPVPGGFAVALPFGQADAASLARLAALGGTIRVAPQRSLILPRRPAELGGFIHDPADPRLRVVTCAGRDGCLRGSTSTAADAGWIAPLLPEGIGLLHLSGCAKGCAHPGSAPWTLTAKTGTYALIRDGRAADAPRLAGLGLAQALAALTADEPR